MKLTLTTLVVALTCSLMHAQGVGIGTATPDSSAILDLSSTSQGLLMPRMTTVQRDSIIDPAVGLQVLNLDDFCMDIYDGISWIKHCGMRITGTDTLPVTGWEQQADFAGIPRASAVAVSVGNKAYIGMGSGAYSLSDFWEFDATTNAWTQLAGLGAGRYGSVAFAINNKIYVCMGYGGAEYLTDLWEYDIASDAWTQKQDFPGVSRLGAVAFVLNGRGYVGTGTKSGIRYNDFWSYDPVTDAWTEEADYPYYTYGGISFTMAGVPYVATGWYSEVPDGGVYYQTLLYHFTGSDWVQDATCPGEPRINAVSFAIGDEAWIGTGRMWNDVLLADFWAYRPTTNSWEQRASLPDTVREHAVAFSIGSKAWVATGENFGMRYDDVWKYDFAPTGNIYTTPLPSEPVYAVSDGFWTKSGSAMYPEHEGNMGIGTQTPGNKFDIAAGGRIGTHPVGLPLYVTNGGIGGVEFRRHDASQGVGIDWNTIYAVGSNENIDLGIFAKGETSRVTLGVDNQSAVSIFKYGKVRFNATVGLGNVVPTSPLHFGDGTYHRRMVVLHDNNTTNDPYHFTGFGIDGSNALVYQVPGAANSHHSFYTGQSLLLQLSEAGANLNKAPLFIGSGTPTKLIMNQGSSSAQIAINPFMTFTASEGHEFTVGSSLVMKILNPYIVSIPTARLGIGTSTPDGLLHVAGWARMEQIGVGISNPGYMMQFANYETPSKLVLSTSPGSFYGFGTESNALRYTVPGQRDHVFFTRTNNMDTELFRISSNATILSSSSIHFTNGVNTLFNMYESASSATKMLFAHSPAFANWGLQYEGASNQFHFKANGADVMSVNLSENMVKVSGNLRVDGGIETEAFIAPALQNGFTNYGATHAVAGFYKDDLKRVCLKGLVSKAGHNGLVIFNLPVGYRPAAGERLLFVAMAESGVSRIDIMPNGDVVVNAASTGWISLDGIAFRTD